MEQPNLNYIDQLCGEDNAFRIKMIDIIKKELPIEISAYHKSMEAHNYRHAAEHVHKLKHKISILGLEGGYNIAQEYENNLLNNIIKYEDEFEKILQLMQYFVNGF
nr:Hpt domain-containing protein [uncultured Flavobacterium sp.]